MSSNTKDIIDKVKNISINESSKGMLLNQDTLLNQLEKCKIAKIYKAENTKKEKEDDYEGALWLTGC